MDSAETLPREPVEVVRRFNRFYTRKIGLLEQKLLSTPFSLAEARVLYELAQQPRTAGTELFAQLGLDRGYLSRILSGFEKQGLAVKQRSKADRRQTLWQLSREGAKAFEDLNERSARAITTMIAGLAMDQQGRLVAALETVRSLLGGEFQLKTPVPQEPYLLRAPSPGDMGWVVERHGVLYAQEYEWDERFEALVADIVAKFMARHDPRRERCWIAERDGENVGCVFLVAESKRVARLRLLLVEPRARGFGLGSRLVKECVGFARTAGYRRVTLWTNSVLVGARKIYQAYGFRLVHQEKHHSFGKELVGQNWELSLELH